VTRDYESLSCAETAKLLRAALKRSFPHTKFSVRSDVYANGASIIVEYTGGPPAQEVRQVAGQYAGAGFDGMIDMQYYRSAYIDVDGIVRGHDSEGTADSRGSVPAVHDPQPPGTRKVWFGANYVSVQRRSGGDDE